MANLNPHANFNQNGQEVFEFYRSAFGGEFDKIIGFKNLSNLVSPIGADEEDKIMHISLPLVA